jgi:hypothetical protein
MPVPAGFRDVLDSLPEDALVLDVGGWAHPDPRADWVIDAGSWATRGYYDRLSGERSASVGERFTEATWVERDVCDPEPWPFLDGTFAFVVCGHILEDVRDPIRVCREMARVGRAGYIETPGALTELTRGVESPLWCGWHHHRWLVAEVGGELTFLLKPHHVHSPFWPAVPSPRQVAPAALEPLRFSWSGTLRAREEIVVDFGELDARLRKLVRAALDGRSTYFTLQRLGEHAWNSYRAVRRLAGRVRRAALQRRPAG